MADSVITQIDASEILSNDNYTPQDESLITSFNVGTLLSTSSYIEVNIYDLNNTLLYNDYNYTSYTIQNDGQAASSGEISSLIINPDSDLQDVGFDQGEYNIYYSFLNKKVGSQIEQLYISEISSDRTEVRLDSVTIDDISLTEQSNAFINERANSDYFLDFYLNFGDNNFALSNNFQLENEDPTNVSLLVKLYEPLSEEYDINSQLWIVTTIEDPLAYNVVFEEEPIIFIDSLPLKGPNFNLDIKDQINNSTNELSYTDLISTNQSSSTNQLNTLLGTKEISINVDYTDFNDFIHFSSAKTRLENFYYKMSLLEEYSSSIAIINTSITGSTSQSLAVNGSKTLYEGKISNILTNFDGYEYHLYYESGSSSWPKTSLTPPYQNATTGSTAVINWFGSTNEDIPTYGGRIESSSFYDGNNKDNLLLSIPQYLRDDTANAPYELFIDMVAQHYDNIWIYTKDVTQKFNSDNRLNYGVSKDIVADSIRDFGIKLYQNNFSNDDLFTAFLGFTSEGALFPFPNITGSLPTPTGYEYIDTFVSASNDYIPLDDVNKSLYKRIYHNLPYLLKSKGTIPGLRALITSYGIPDTILKISEFGGKDKVNTNDWDYYFNKFNYKFDTLGDTYISTLWGINDAWSGGTSNTNPSSLEFRFKTEEFPPTNLSQSICSFNQGGTSIASLSLQYTGSGLTSGSYNGSIKDPYYQYANLTFYPSSSDLTTSASIYLPFFDGDWWSVMINSGSNGYEVFAKNKIYNGNTGTSLGFQSSASITSSYDGWSGASNIYFGSGSLHSNFSGSYQEVRYYKNALSESVFNDYVMNPLSIEGNSLNASPNELIFRASLGSELNFTVTESIHPKVTGSWLTTSSFDSNVNTFNILKSSGPNSGSFSGNTEYYFLDQPAVGIKNRITDKVRLEDNVIPNGDTLSPFHSLLQQTAASSSYTPNINLLEVAFSPQNQINDDIIGQIGYFDIGEYIGDPSFRSSSLNSYPTLDKLRDDYFEKYTKNYDLFGFIRLIKYFDNSLFKMIKDFIPARTSLASGIVIKQHLLERNRVPQVQPNLNTTIAKYGKSGSIHWNEPIITQNLIISGTLKPQWNNYEEGKIVNSSGSTAGSFNTFNSIEFSPLGSNGISPNNIFSITQSWNEVYPTLSGSVTVLHDSQDEFYNGEFSGSTLVVTTQDLNRGCDQYKNVNPKGLEISGVRMYSGSGYNFESFINKNNHPTDGYISIWYQNPTDTPLPPPGPQAPGAGGSS